MRNILYSDSKKCTVYVIDLLLNVTYAPINVNPQRGVRAYVGYLIINCIPTLGILISILAYAGTPELGRQEGQPPPFPSTRRGKGDKGALSMCPEL